MKRKHYVLISAILLIMIIAICIFVGRDKLEEIVPPKGESEQNEQVDNNDEGIMEDQVFEDEDSAEKNKESEENNLSEIPLDSGEKEPTRDVQDGSGEESSEGDSETEQPENGSVELPRVPLN